MLRCVHLVLSIPVLGYVYGEPSEVQEYASAVRFAFLPAILLSGFWMYAGVVFAILGVALWLGLYLLLGVGAAITGQIVLFIARLLWLRLRRRAASPS
ncbi:MAG: hypothetical protein M3Y80_08955 [Verrucomicrobiota bacterium]|nr:hypothetical protein [Verrucomicrobiota bacterium]